jgi:putative FmdB family regulatory protein
MPTYTYRREDGTTFEVRQKFTDAPLSVDPATGQQVVRVVQAAGVIFKGSGFYVTDTRSSNSANPKANGSGDAPAKGSDSNSSEAKSTDASKKSSEATPIPTKDK